MAGTRPGRALRGSPHGAVFALPLRNAVQQLLQVWQLQDQQAMSLPINLQALCLPCSCNKLLHSKAACAAGHPCPGLCSICIANLAAADDCKFCQETDPAVKQLLQVWQRHQQQARLPGLRALLYSIFCKLADCKSRQILPSDRLCPMLCSCYRDLAECGFDQKHCNMYQKPLRWSYAVQLATCSVGTQACRLHTSPA